LEDWTTASNSGGCCLMSAKQSTAWYWSDWAGDEAVRSLTPAERGMWIDLLALAARGNPTGYVCDARGAPVAVEQIAHFANCSAAEAASLIDGILAKGVASRDRSGRLFNRRIVRDVELSVKKRRAGQAGAAATALKWHQLNGVPGQVPGHVPRHAGRAPYQKEKLTSSFVGAARAKARDGTEVSKQEKESGSAEVASGNGIAPGDSLSEVIKKKGWV
jgi:hypothetical protein